MTILVGVLCRDGVVIGADSSATLGTGQHRTIEQPIAKIDIIATRFILAGTGYVGHNQRFKDTIERSGVHKRMHEISCIEVGRILAKEGMEDFVSTLSIAANGQPRAPYGALVAFYAKKQFGLCEFDVQHFQPELKNEKFWYVSMGSGQVIVDPFLGMIRRVFWSGGPPNTQDGVFAVTWALRHAIELNPGGIGGEKAIAVMKLDENNKPLAKLLSADEISEHDANVIDMERHIGEFRLQQSGEKPVPQAPPIPSQA